MISPSQDIAAPWFVTRKRRTYSVHATAQDAKEALYDLVRLLNGTPFGYVMAVQQKMGKFAAISYRSSDQ